MWTTITLGLLVNVPHHLSALQWIVMKVCKHQSPSPFDCVLVRVRDHEIHAINNSHLQAREGLGEVVCITPFYFNLIEEHTSTHNC